MDISSGTPTVPGLYVAYVEPSFSSMVKARRELLLFHSGGWSYPSSDQMYRGSIYGWIGPLPHLSLDEVAFL